jgi:hypothetical protein
MSKQDISGSANQQAGGDIYNHTYPAAPAVACISGAQAFQLKWLVDNIDFLLTGYSKHSSTGQIWADLHDYCHTPAPLPGEKRSQYRLMPASTFHRAKSYLLEQMWVARLTGKSKRKVRLYFNGVSQASEDIYDDDANPDVVQKYLRKCDEVDDLKQQIIELTKQLAGKNQEFQSGPTQQNKIPLPNSVNSDGVSTILLWHGVNGSDTYASVWHDGETGNAAETNVEIDMTNSRGINFSLDSSGQLSINVQGGAEREIIAITFEQISRELNKQKDQLGGRYQIDPYEPWGIELSDYEQAITNSENGD